MVSLKLFGSATLEVEGEAVTGPPAQRHRLALLAVLATSPSRTLTRDKLLAYLWPERDSESGRKLLNQSVYALRKTLGEDVILSVAEELRLDTSRIHCDVVAFEEALTEGELPRAVDLYSGPFLDGFHLNRAPDFEHWVEIERKQLADAYGGALEELAEAAETRGAVRSAVQWWKALAIHDPYDSRVAVRLVEALESMGNPAGAIGHAVRHARRLNEELGIDPPRELGEAVERLRSGPKYLGGLDEEDKSAFTEGEPSPRTPSGRAGTRRAIARPAPAPDSDVSERSRSTISRAAAAVLLAVVVLVGSWLTIAPTDASLDSNEEEVPLSDIEGIVARELDRRLGEPTVGPSRDARTQSIAAYELYLRGTDPSLLRNDSTVRVGVEHLGRAITLDSTYAAPWAGLACLYLRLTTAEDTNSSREELHRLAEEAALRAVELDDSLSEAHASLGLVRMAAFDFTAAERHLKSAVALDSARTRPREWLVTVHLATGRSGQALEEAEDALDVDPLSPTANAEMARALGSNGRCDEALARLRRLASLQPPLLRAGAIGAYCYAQTGRLQEAIRVLRAQAEGSPDTYSVALLGHMLARAGQREEAAGIRERLEARWERPGGGAFPVAIVEAGLGDLDETFLWLDRAVDDTSLIGTPLHVQIVRTLGGVLGDDPRYQELLQRLDLEAVHAES